MMINEINHYFVLLTSSDWQTVSASGSMKDVSSAKYHCVSNSQATEIKSVFKVSGVYSSEPPVVHRRSFVDVFHLAPL